MTLCHIYLLIMHAIPDRKNGSYYWKLAVVQDNLDVDHSTTKEKNTLVKCTNK